jgi:hypothetical protein
VKYVHGVHEPHRVDRSVGVAVVRLDELQDAGSKPFSRLRGGGHATELGDAKRVPHFVPDRLRKIQEVALRRPYPVQGLLVGRQDPTHLENIPLRV